MHGLIPVAFLPELNGFRKRKSSNRPSGRIEIHPEALDNGLRFVLRGVGDFEFDLKTETFRQPDEIQFRDC